MSDLQAALKKLEDWIQNSQSRHADFIRCGSLWGLRGGLSAEKIELDLWEIGLEVSDELLGLYQWRDGGIKVGDYANPIYFLPLYESIKLLKSHGFSQLPIFVGDCVYYFAEKSNRGDICSSISCYVDYGAEHQISAYAPNITGLIKALAECAETYDGISAHNMEGDLALKLPDFVEDRSFQGLKKLLDEICAQHGLVSIDGDKGGNIWW